MAFLLGTGGGALFLPSSASAAEDAYAPVRRLVPDPDVYHEIVGDLWKDVGDIEIIESVWQSLLLFLAGEMLRYTSAVAARSLVEVPVLTQKKWVRYKLRHAVDMVSDPGWTAAGMPRFDYAAGAVNCTWLNRLGRDSYTTPLRSAATESATLEWSVDVTVDTLPTPPANQPSLALFGYAQDSADGEGGIYVGIGRNGQLALLHVENSGTATVQWSVAGVLAAGVRYEVSASYDGITGYATAEVYRRDVLLLDKTGVGEGAAAVDDASGGGVTATLQDASVADFVAAGVAIGSTFQLYDPGTGSVLLTTPVVSVTTTTVVVQAAVFAPGVGPIAYRIYGRQLAATLGLDVAGTAVDSAFTVSRFGLRTLDLQRWSPQGTTWSALGLVAANGFTGRVHSLTYLDPSVESNVRDMPYLQPNPLSDDGLLVYPGDFSLDATHLTFAASPPDLLYAEYVRCNEGVIEANFGSLVGLSGEDSAAYLAAVQALFFAFYRGATPTNVRRGVHVYMGLPIAIEGGTVSAVNTVYSGDYGLITVDGASTRTYLYPLSVGTALLVGDVVVQYQSLCNGVQVRDYLSNPLWWLPYVSSGFSELEKYHVAEVVVDGSVFDISAVSDVVSFLNSPRFKKTWKKVFLRITRSITDTLVISDDVYVNGTVVIEEPVFPFDVPRYDSDVAFPGVTVEADGYEPMFRGVTAATWSDVSAAKTPVAFAWERSGSRSAGGLATGTSWSLGTTVAGLLQPRVLHDRTKLIPETVRFLVFDTALGSYTEWEDDGAGTVVCTSHAKYSDAGVYSAEVNYATGFVDFTLGSHDLTDVWACYATQYVHVPGSANTAAVPVVDWWYDQTPDATSGTGDPVPLALDYVDPATAAVDLNNVRVAHPTGFSWPLTGSDLAYMTAPIYDPLTSAAMSAVPGVGGSGLAGDPGQPGSSELLLVGGAETTGDPPDGFYDGYREQGPDEELTVTATNVSGGPIVIVWFGASTPLSTGASVTHTEVEAALVYP